MLLFLSFEFPNSRDPSLRRLHGEQREHGHEAVVVVERLPLPLPGEHGGRRVVAGGELKVLASEKQRLKLNLVFVSRGKCARGFSSVLALFGGVLADVGAVVELPVEQLHAHHGEDELREL